MAQVDATPGAAIPPVPRLAWWTLAVALVLGAVLRLIWPADIEWKRDEFWSYQKSLEAGSIGSWPKLGMETSLSKAFRNPGLSVWVFIAAGRFVSTPPAMARIVEVTTILALVGFALATRAWVPAAEREPWLWGIALHAVNPMAVRMSRKIWPPAVFPPFLLALWVGHLNRTKRWGAFLWGISGALIGQIHLSGWYVAAGIVAGTVFSERFRKQQPAHSRWGWWLLGSALGALPAISWIRSLFELSVTSQGNLSAALVSVHAYVFVIFFSFFTLGVEFDRGLGLQRDVPRFLEWPMLPDGPTWLMYLLHWGILYAAAVLFFALLLWPFSQTIRRVLRLRELSQPRPRYPLVWWYAATTLLLPFLMYIITIDVYFYHYFYIFSLFACVSLAALVLPWRPLLLVLVICQAVISATFLGYVHDRGGAYGGEFGATFARQLRDRTTVPPRFEPWR